MSDSNHPFNRPEFTLKKARPKKSLIIIVASLVLLLAVSGGAVYLLREHIFGAEQVSTSEALQPVDKAALSETVAVATTYVANGDITTAVAVLDEAIEKTNSSAQKAALYRSKATVIANTDRSAAINAAEQSVVLDSNFENTAYLAQLYERNGDKEKAIEYYGKAITLYNQMESEEGGPISAEMYQIRIDSLRGQ